MTINKLQASTFDELYTPTEAVMPLIRHLPEWVKTVWCPCDTEDSKIVLALRNAGYNVIATHIRDGRDFFTIREPEGYDIIVTNPPYSNKSEFIARCIELGMPWSLLLPLDALCGARRFELYKGAKWRTGVITIASRVDFTGKNRPWFNVVWVVSVPGLEEKWIQEDC